MGLWLAVGAGVGTNASCSRVIFPVEDNNVPFIWICSLMVRFQGAKGPEMPVEYGGFCIPAPRPCAGSVARWLSVTRRENGTEAETGRCRLLLGSRFCEVLHYAVTKPLAASMIGANIPGGCNSE